MAVDYIDNCGQPGQWDNLRKRSQNRANSLENPEISPQSPTISTLSWEFQNISNSVAPLIVVEEDPTYVIPTDRPSHRSTRTYEKYNIEVLEYGTATMNCGSRP
jgi:hypothetical protein